MSEKIYSDWFNYSEQIYKIINNTLEDVIIIIQPQEFLFFNQQELIFINNELTNKNKKLVIYIGSEFYSVDYSLYNNIEIIYWDSIDFFAKSQIFNIDSSEQDIIFYFNKKEIVPVSLFTSMCSLKNCRNWRFYIINELFKNDLCEKNNFIFRIEDGTILDNFKLNDKEFDIDSIDFSKILLFSSNKPWDWMLNILPNSYMISSFDIVCETSYEYFFVTEKTLRPLDSKKPFIVFSCYNFHNKLKKYGFKLYDEIIDYSFDNIIDTKERFDMQIYELKKLLKYTPEEIYNITKEKVDFNFKVLSELRLKKNVDIPEYIYDIIDEKFFPKLYSSKNIENDVNTNIVDISIDTFDVKRKLI